MHGASVTARLEYIERLIQKPDPAMDGICKGCFNKVERFVKNTYTSSLITRVDIPGLCYVSIGEKKKVPMPKGICNDCYGIAEGLAKEARKEARSNTRYLDESKNINDPFDWRDWENAELESRFYYASERRKRARMKNKGRPTEEAANLPSSSPP